jgi:UDP-hydrolysing UDP-N-acetyl-D-glucosamine 2-epimerase
MLNSKRLIGVFTGNRAEYGLQYPIIKAIDKCEELDYRLIVSGAHLDPNFGQTLQEINNDGIEVYAEAKIQTDFSLLNANPLAIGSAITEISNILANLKPHIFLVYADRFEGLAAVIASSQMNIPTAHVEGGDLTEGGALDDSVRHAMTKLAHLHFTTNEQSANRILAMGEESWRVHNVGFPAIDLIDSENYASVEEIKKRIPLDFTQPIILFTQHPVTTEPSEAKSQIQNSLGALMSLSSRNYQIILTYPNNDIGSQLIIEEIESSPIRLNKNVFITKSLGRYLYHGLLSLTRNEKHRIVCVGNSSSGIKETPAFGCPTVNIGSRQEGRLRGQNVIDVEYQREEIENAIEYALFNDAFRLQSRRTKNPYWKGNAGEQITQVLSKVNIDKKLLRKKMTLRGEINGEWFC